MPTPTSRHMRLLPGLLLLLGFCVASSVAGNLTLADFHGGEVPVTLREPWRFHGGDSAHWADPAYADSHWTLRSPTLPVKDVLSGKVPPLGWFRTTIRLDSELLQRSLYLYLRHHGAIEVFWDGRPVYALGTVSADPAGEWPMVRYYGEPVRLETAGAREHVLAVRFSAHQARTLRRTGEAAGFVAELHSLAGISAPSHSGQDLRLLGWGLVAGLSLTLMLLHLIIYLLFPRMPENFDFALFAGSASAAALLILVTFILAPLTFEQFAFRSVLTRLALLYMPLTGMHFMHAINGKTEHNRADKLRFLALLVAGAALAVFLSYPMVYLAMLLVSIELLRALFIAIRRRVERIWILGIGFSYASGIVVLHTAVSFGLLPGGSWVEFVSISSLAVLMFSASIYLGTRFASANHALQAKIEEGRRAVRALAESEARYRVIVENPIVGVGIVDETNSMIYVNDRYLEIVRSRHEDVVGRDVRKRILPEYIDEINAKIGRLYKGDVATVTAEFGILAGDGERRIVLASASLYRTRQGHRHMVVHNIDVTDVRAAERKQREALSLAEQTARMASIGVMAGGITHEINQPLNAIMLHAETLQFMAKHNRLDQTEPVTTALNHIVLGTERISEIIQHMRSFWIDGAGPAELARVDLNGPVRQAVQMTAQKVHAHAIALELRLADSPPCVRADALQLEQIVINLLTNAVNALDRVKQREKKILIRTETQNGEVVLEVTDNGPGLPAIDPEKLFDPFFSTGKEKGGTGLGLAIVKMFVEKFRGKVTAATNAAGGATFCVRLPRAEG